MDLSQKQLSKQQHYDFGLRNLKSILNKAGELKVTFPNYTDFKLVLKAIQIISLPKFISKDKILFINILKEVFAENFSNQIKDEKFD